MNKKDINNTEELMDLIKENIYQVSNPLPNDTDCGSERIVNAIVNITLASFNFAVKDTGLNLIEKRYFCGEDLLRNAINKINKELDIEKIDTAKFEELKKLSHEISNKWGYEMADPKANGYGAFWIPWDETGSWGTLEEAKNNCLAMNDKNEVLWIWSIQDMREIIASTK